MNDDDAAFLVSALSQHEPPSLHDPLFIDPMEFQRGRAASSNRMKAEDGNDSNDAIFFHNLDLIFAYDPPPLPELSLSLAPAPIYRFQVKLTTTFLPRYWKNGRKNLQCFPLCPEHGDFYDMKIQGKKHASIGVCRTPVNCEVVCPLWLPHLYLLARFEQISPGTPVIPPPMLQGLGEFDAYRRDAFEAVQIGKCITLDGGGCKSTWMFLPDVWKIQPLLRKKRKATRSSPAETFPFYFRVFCYLKSPADGTNPVDWFRCVAECHSTAFELSSTRTADRHRKINQ